MLLLLSTVLGFFFNEKPSPLHEEKCSLLYVQYITEPERNSALIGIQAGFFDCVDVSHDWSLFDSYGLVFFIFIFIFIFIFVFWH